MMLCVRQRRSQPETDVCKGDDDFDVDRPVEKPRRGGRKSGPKAFINRSPIAGILDELSDDLLLMAFALLDPPDLLAVARARCVCVDRVWAYATTSCAIPLPSPRTRP